MPEQSKRIEQALHGCAEVGVPETVDLWPQIRERATATPRRSPRQFRLSPRTRLGWVFAVLTMVLIASTAAFATAGALGILDDLFGNLVPDVQEEELSVSVNQTQSRNGITVTIDRVYADSLYVVVGYTVRGVTGAGNPEALPSLANVSLSDPDGKRKFNDTEGIFQVSATEQGSPIFPENYLATTTLFEASRPLEANKDHRFRARVFIGGPEGPMSEDGSSDATRLSKPFVFDFTVPVMEASTIEVNQTVKAGGVPITLTEVANSPARTTAYLCFDPPDEIFDLPWVTTPETRDFPGPEPADVPVYHKRDEFHGPAREGCATYIFGESLYNQPGEHSLTVTELHSSQVETNSFRKGPWKFTFEIPEP